jgi:hypothetical protein
MAFELSDYRQHLIGSGTIDRKLMQPSKTRTITQGQALPWTTRTGLHVHEEGQPTTQSDLTCELMYIDVENVHGPTNINACVACLRCNLASRIVALSMDRGQ